MVMTQDRPAIWTGGGPDDDVLDALRRGASPKEIVLIASGQPAQGEVIPFHMLTGPLVATTRDFSALDRALSNAPVLRGTTSSNSPDLHRSRMKPTALEQMRSTILDDMTFFMNHEYRVPEDVLGRGVEAALNKRHEPKDNITWTDLDVGVLVVNEIDNPRAAQIYRQVLQKVRLGFSIGAYILAYQWEEEGTMEPVTLTEEEEECVWFFGPPPDVIMGVDSVMLIESSSVGIPSNRRSWARTLSWDAQIFGSMREVGMARSGGKAPKRPVWDTGRTYSLPATRAVTSINSTPEEQNDGRQEDDQRAAPEQAGGDHGHTGERAAHAAPPASAAPVSSRPKRRGAGRTAAGEQAAPASAQPGDPGDHAALARTGGSGGGGGGAASVVNTRGENDGTAGSPLLTAPFRDLERQAQDLFAYGGAQVSSPTPPQHQEGSSGLIERAMQQYQGHDDMRLYDPEDDDPQEAMERAVAQRYWGKEDDPEERPAARGLAQRDPEPEPEETVELEDDPQVWGPLVPDAEATEERATDADKTAQQTRSTRYGIAVKKGGNVTKPMTWGDVPDSQWGDPVNYRYPMPDKDHADNAASRWGDGSNRAGYSKKEQGIVGGRIDRRQRHFGEGNEADATHAAPGAGLEERSSMHPINGRHGHEHYHGDAMHEHQHGHDGEGDHSGHYHTPEQDSLLAAITTSVTRAAATHPHNGSHTHEHTHNGSLHSHRHAHANDGRHAGHAHTAAQADALAEEAGESAGMEATENEDAERTARPAAAPAGERGARSRAVGAEYTHLLTWAARRVENCRGEPLSAQQVDDLLGLHGVLTNFLAERGLLEESQDDTQQSGAHRGALTLIHPAQSLRGGADAHGARSAEEEWYAELRREIAAAQEIRSELMETLGVYSRQAAQLRRDLSDYDRRVAEIEEVSMGRPTQRGGYTEREQLERSRGLSRDELMILTPDQAAARMRAEMDA